MTPVSLSVWYAALGSPFGIVYQTSDPESAKQKLYRLRAEANDPDLDHISICSSPTTPQTDLWLVKKEKS